MNNFNKARKELCSWLGIDMDLLINVLYKKKEDEEEKGKDKKEEEARYRTFRVDKKSGGVREINAPCEQLLEVQRKLYEKILKIRNDYYKGNEGKLKISHGFERGKNIITNARIHKGKRTVINMDIKDFFPSIHFGRVQGFFYKNTIYKFSYEWSILIAQLTTYRSRLPQGAPTSPLIANLIFSLADMRIYKVAKKYKMYYTRYADDLTFSTNDRKIRENFEDFKNDIIEALRDYGFEINNKKTRMIFNDSRQEVTGLTVNEKINIPRKFADDTRAMVNSMFERGYYIIDKDKDIIGSMNQLEGRLSFINQIDWYNNKLYNENILPVYRIHDKYKHDLFNKREKYYRDFLFYKYFYAPVKPVIVTEGKTDIMHIKAALMHYYYKFPNLIEIKNGKFYLKICCLNKNKRMKYFFGLVDGASSMRNIYSAYKGQDNFKNSYEYIDRKRKKCLISTGRGIVNGTIKDTVTSDKYFIDAVDKIIKTSVKVDNNDLNSMYSDSILEKIGSEYINSGHSDSADITFRNPVILLMDNERNKNDQLVAFLSNTKSKLDYDEISCHIFKNLYLQTLPLTKEKINELRARDNDKKRKKDLVDGIEIEDLYFDSLLIGGIDGKSFTKEDNFDRTKYVGKFEFASYVKKNYGAINFERFLPLLESIDKLVTSGGTK